MSDADRALQEKLNRGRRKPGRPATDEPGGGGDNAGDGVLATLNAK